MRSDHQSHKNSDNGNYGMAAYNESRAQGIIMKFACLLPVALVVATMCVVLVAPVRAATTMGEPTPRQAVNAMPGEVRALLPTGATSLYVGRLPMGAQGQLLLAHLWTAGHKAAPGSHDQFEPSPFHVDLFKFDSQGSGKPGHWFRVATTVYQGTDGPRQDRSNDVSVRWLQPAKKQAPVLIIVSPAYIDIRYTVITYPQGIKALKTTGSYVQQFYQGGVGGGKTIYNFGIDKHDTMTVLEENWYQGSRTATKVLSWNGQQYVAVASSHQAK